MTLTYILIGFAVVYAAFVLGAKKNSNQPNLTGRQARLTGQIDQPTPGNTHIPDTSYNTQKQHKGHGCC
ncbi:MAG: hypothetical protein ACYC6P_16305 [Ignavibacteriaceae bacterium]